MQLWIVCNQTEFQRCLIMYSSKAAERSAGNYKPDTGCFNTSHLNVLEICLWLRVKQIPLSEEEQNLSNRHATSVLQPVPHGGSEDTGLMFPSLQLFAAEMETASSNSFVSSITTSCYFLSAALTSSSRILVPNLTKVIVFCLLSKPVKTCTQRCTDMKNSLCSNVAFDIKL